MKNKKGQVLIGVLALLVMLAIIIPTMVKYVQHETKWSVKQEQNTNAFQLAEAAVDRGYQKIAESTSTWKAIQNGTVQTGFNFDTVYSDIEGGTYAIRLSSGPNSGEATILTVGRDKMKRETRALKVVYSKGGVDSAMYASGISISGGVVINWGPMKSRVNITLGGASDVEYPRKFAVGSITGYTGSCTDTVENWAYNCSPGVPPPPTIDLEGYKATAQATKCATTSNFPAGAVPAGSCYWPGDANFNGTDVMTSTRTIYVAGNTIIKNTFLWGNVIAAKNLDFQGGGKGEYIIPTAGAPTPFTGGIPAEAWREYRRFDTAALNQYYGDNGLATLNATFRFQTTGSPDQRLGINASPTVRGFVYCGGVLDAAGGTLVHGVVFSPTGIAGLNGNINIFYDNNVAQAIETSTIYPTRISWLGSKQAWPSALP